ncbi:MAG TPA: aldo/keto reductase [Thermoleophilaceae bacterium]|nr:aldo/keto reductase [Thermoleophilaceae bacterium]
MTLAPTIELLDGGRVPRLGLGTWPLDDDAAYAAVATALEQGYRLIDSAARYDNEAGVGRAVADSDVPREEIVVTTKLPGADHGYEEALAGFEASRRRLGLEYVDLYLIHWPLPSVDRYVDTWRAFVHLREEGLTRSIGVSNFTPAQIERIVEATGVWPAVNQIELHPEFPQAEARAWHAEQGVAIESWRPLGRGVLDYPVVGRLAAAHGRTPAQIVLRWHMQLGLVAIPKSGNPERIAQNIDVFDFELSDDDMAAIGALDRDNRLGGDPDTHVEL